MYFRILIIFLFAFISAVADAQDPSFSQFYANPVNLNPAFTGTTELPRLVLQYRNQWPTRGATFTTYSVSFDMILPKSNARTRYIRC
jgi:hypothetical protein